MFKFSNWFFCVASFLVFIVVCEADDAAALKSSPVVELTAKEKQEVVDRHNFYRRKEGASNMKKMKWNDYLADMASEWVSGCVFEHGNPHREAKEIPFEYIGQNILSSGGRMDQGAVTDAFAKEKQDFIAASNACKKGRVCGHYTQVVWGDSTDVGCGVAHCNSTWNYVCNYGPGGNYVGQKPFEKGTACSKCTGAFKCDDGLCEY